MQGMGRHPKLAAVAGLIASLLSGAAAAQETTGAVSGTVLDPLGARVPAAAVTLVRDGMAVADTKSDEAGHFALASVETGRYRLKVQAEGFEPQTTRSFFAGSGGAIVLDVPLQIGLKQNVVVTASAMEAPASQVAAPVTVLDRQTLEDLAKPSVHDALRLMPGAHVAQAGGRGGTTSLFVRGGAANFNKVLVDGIPVNDLGGAFNFADLSATGVERVEALRDAMSVLHGSDALAGVVSVTTRRGQTRVPELSASAEAGNLGTHREEATLGGTARRFDYFGAYSHFATDNRVPNNAYTNDTVVGRAGWALGSKGDVSATVRHQSSDYGVPNAFELYGLADDSTQAGRSTYAGLVAQSQLGPGWHGAVSYTHLTLPTNREV